MHCNTCAADNFRYVQLRCRNTTFTDPFIPSSISFHFMSCHVISFHFVSFNQFHFMVHAISLRFVSLKPSNHAGKNSKKAIKILSPKPGTICIGDHLGPTRGAPGEHFGGHHGNHLAQITKWHYSTQIPTGWWLTYPSEKYECQLGLLFQNTDQPKTTAFFCVSGV